MTLDEAIKIFETVLAELKDPPPTQFRRAIGLGLEALKRERRERAWLKYHAPPEEQL